MTKEVYMYVSATYNKDDKLLLLDTLRFNVGHGVLVWESKTAAT